MPRTHSASNFRTTDISTDVDTIASGDEATNSATIARFAAGGVVSSRRFKPGAATGPEAAVPASPSTAAGMGWRQNPAINASEPITIQAQTWTIILKARRSGQTLEQDQNSDTTVIVYRVSSTGTHISEIGRRTLRFTWTTTATDRVFTITPGAQEFNTNDRIQIEVYVVTLNNLNVVAAPAVATDLILQVGSASDSALDALTYFIRYARTPADTAGATDSLVRSAGRFSRALADSAPSSEALARKVSRFRSIADSASASDSLARRVVSARALADSVSGSDALGRSAGRFARGLADSAPATEALSRRAVMARSVTDQAPTADSLARFARLIRPLTDAAPASETLARSAGRFSRNLTDSAPASESLSRTVNYARALADSAPATETLGRVVRFNRSIVDTALASDALARQLAAIRGLSDSAPAADVLGRRVTYVRNIEDNIGPTGGGETVIIVKKIFPVFDD